MIITALAQFSTYESTQLTLEAYTEEFVQGVDDCINYTVTTEGLIGGIGKAIAWIWGRIIGFFSWIIDCFKSLIKAILKVFGKKSSGGGGSSSGDDEPNKTPKSPKPPKEPKAPKPQRPVPPPITPEPEPPKPKKPEIPKPPKPVKPAPKPQRPVPPPITPEPEPPKPVAPKPAPKPEPPKPVAPKPTPVPKVTPHFITPDDNERGSQRLMTYAIDRGSVNYDVDVEHFNFDKVSDLLKKIASFISANIHYFIPDEIIKNKLNLNDLFTANKKDIDDFKTKIVNICNGSENESYNYSNSADIIRNLSGHCKTCIKSIEKINNSLDPIVKLIKNNNKMKIIDSQLKDLALATAFKQGLTRFQMHVVKPTMQLCSETLSEETRVCKIVAKAMGVKGDDFTKASYDMQSAKSDYSWS